MNALPQIYVTFFTELCANNTAFYAVGDYNIDLMQINVNQNYRKYVNSPLISQLA